VWFRFLHRFKNRRLILVLQLTALADPTESVEVLLDKLFERAAGNFAGNVRLVVVRNGRDTVTVRTEALNEPDHVTLTRIKTQELTRNPSTWYRFSFVVSRRRKILGCSVR
jgi:hypothetical protein